MSARLGAGSTPLGQRIRRVQDLSDRVLRLNAEDNALLADWSAVQRQDARYSAAQEEFRAASLARGKATAPTVKRQTELVQQLTALMQRCPPGQKRTGCEGSEAEIKAIGQQLAELSKASASAWRRRRKCCPATRPSARGARHCAASSIKARMKSARCAPRSSNHFPSTPR
jgi:hypothetical protein